MLWSCSQCLLTFHYPIWLLQGRVSWQSHPAKAGQPLWSSCRSSTTLPSLLYIRRKPVLFTGLVIGVFTEKWPQHCQITILPYEHTHLVFLLGGSYSLTLHTLGKKGNDYTHVYCSSCYQTRSHSNADTMRRTCILDLSVGFNPTTFSQTVVLAHYFLGTTFLQLSQFSYLSH